jgi:Phospholipase_D-nuclease N-terminal
LVRCAFAAVSVAAAVEAIDEVENDLKTVMIRGIPRNQQEGAMLFVQEGFTFRNFLMDALAIFVFIVWFWLLITVASDLFRRHDISGWAKALWVIVLVVAPYIGVFAYLIFQGRGMAERNAQQAQEAREELRRVVGFSAADEIEKLDRLKKAGSISDAEFARLRAKLV